MSAQESAESSSPFEERDFGNGRPYKVVPERLTVIDGIEYVRCPLHGLIPLDHHCATTPFDHWCRSAAHPNIDVSQGVGALDDQGVSWDEWRRLEAERVHALTDALLRACLYLDGFLWLHDPEASELDAIKETVATAMGYEMWEQAKARADAAEEGRRGT